MGLNNIPPELFCPPESQISAIKGYSFATVKQAMSYILTEVLNIPWTVFLPNAIGKYAVVDLMWQEK